MKALEQTGSFKRGFRKSIWRGQDETTDDVIVTLVSTGSHSDLFG